MRYSTEPSDPGYANWCKARQTSNPRYYLNGKERQHVVMADEESGEMVKLREPLKLGPGRQWIREAHKGQVRIEA
jgi:hypothetical protein